MRLCLVAALIISIIAIAGSAFYTMTLEPQTIIVTHTQIITFSKVITITKEPIKEDYSEAFPWSSPYKGTVMNIHYLPTEPIIYVIIFEDGLIWFTKQPPLLNIWQTYIFWYHVDEDGYVVIEASEEVELDE